MPTSGLDTPGGCTIGGTSTTTSGTPLSTGSSIGPGIATIPMVSICTLTDHMLVGTITTTHQSIMRTICTWDTQDCTPPTDLTVR